MTQKGKTALTFPQIEQIWSVLLLFTIVSSTLMSGPLPIFGQSSGDPASEEFSPRTEEFSPRTEEFGQSGGEFLIYRNPDLGVTVKYPDTWVELPSDGSSAGVIAEFSSQDEADLRLVHMEGQGMTLDQYSREFIDLLEGDIGAEVVEVTDVSVAGQPAVRAIYAAPSEDQFTVLAIENTWTSIQPNGFLHLVFVANNMPAFERNMDAAYQIVSSLQIVPSSVSEDVPILRGDSISNEDLPLLRTHE